MALYESDPTTKSPGHLIDQTAETSAHALERDYSGALNECGSGGLEMRTPKRQPVESGGYWLFVIASANLGLEVLPTRVELLTSQDDVDYASLEQMPDTADQRSPLRSTINLYPSAYVVLTPLP